MAACTSFDVEPVSHVAVTKFIVVPQWDCNRKSAHLSILGV